MQDTITIRETFSSRDEAEDARGDLGRYGVIPAGLAALEVESIFPSDFVRDVLHMIASHKLDGAG